MVKSDSKYEHIVITGASSGIGEALAKFYAAENIMLTLIGRNEERLRNVAESCKAAGAKSYAAIVDVTDQKALSDVLVKADQRKPIDLLIANAGISAGTGGNPDGEAIEQARRIFAVNWFGVLNTIEPVLPKMIERGQGQIVLMSSLAGFRGWPGAPAYCASKAAVKTYGESLRGSLEDTGVKVNVVCPGFVKSRITDANDFPMPFIMSAECASAIIDCGLQKNRGRICFPFISFLVSWFLALLPDSCAQFLLKPTPAKGL